MSHADPKLERAFLGAVLTGEGDNDHLLATVRAVDFTDDACRRVFSEMAAARARGVRLDARLVASIAGQEGFINELVEAVATPAGADEYARRLSDLGGLREVAKINGTAIAHEAESLEMAVAEMRQRLSAVETGRSRERMATGEECAKDYFEHLLNTNTPPGLDTGIEPLDRALGGLLPASLVIIAARPGVGKSALMLNIAEHQALRVGGRVALFSLEMPKRQITGRLVSSVARIDQSRLKHRILDDVEWARASAAASKIAGAPLLVLDRGVNISTLYAAAKSEHARSPLACVVVDYLQLVKGSRLRKGENREQEVAEVARELKTLAMDLGVPVIAGAQLNREVEKRADKRPMLADLRESGEIEQSADVVVMLHREWMTDKSAHPEEAEALIRKNRHGEQGEMRLRFNGPHCRFEAAQ